MIDISESGISLSDNGVILWSEIDALVKVHCRQSYWPEPTGVFPLGRLRGLSYFLRLKSGVEKCILRADDFKDSDSFCEQIRLLVLAAKKNSIRFESRNNLSGAVSAGPKPLRDYSEELSWLKRCLARNRINDFSRALFLIILFVFFAILNFKFKSRDPDPYKSPKWQQTHKFNF